MKKYLLLMTTFFITGCPGPGDRMVSRESTTVVTHGDQVCIVSTLHPDEKITAVQVNNETNYLLHKTFDDNPVYIPENKCLPLFGIRVIPGHRYSFAYDITSKRQGSYLLTSEFSVRLDDAGLLKVF